MMGHKQKLKGGAEEVLASDLANEICEYMGL